MAKLRGKEIIDIALKIIAEHPNGIRPSQLKKLIVEQHPETPINTIGGNTWNLDETYPSLVVKPSRGLFVPAGRVSTSDPTPTIVGNGKFKEEDFYEPFAEWLKSDLGEATTAVPVGGAGLQKKWGTPDVVGVYKPVASDRIKFDLEIIAGEVKIDPYQPVVAFGQAVAYRLFAAKSYMAMPESIPEDDYSRLEALCMLFGVGLVLFRLDIRDPQFRIRVRAQRFPPDMFYVNEFADRLCRLDPSVFNQLFG